MSSGIINCAKCDTRLPVEIINRPGFISCPGCGVPVKAHIFPALYRRIETVKTGEGLLTDNEAGCFFHPAKKAVIPCEICGRFLCSLCDIEFNDQHVCPSCLEAGKKKRKIRNLENNRALYDNIALSLSVIPLLFIWPTIITAPASIYFSIRHWKSPSSIIPRTKVRFILAGFFSIMQIAGWAMFITYI